MKRKLMIMKITLLTGKIFDLEKAFPFPLKINKTTKSRKLTLKIDSKKREAHLSLPLFCSIKTAHKFVAEHQEWIEEHLTKIPQAKRFENGDKISLLGQEVVICHVPHSLQAACLQNGKLFVGGEAAFLHRRVKDFIKRAAKKDFMLRSQIFAAQINCEVKSVTIKDTSSRWGSCSTLNNINYNWRIALAPECVINYLTAHETAHLKHRDHSPAFWRCVKQLYPGASLGRAWLKAHGNELYLYE